MIDRRRFTQGLAAAAAGAAFVPRLAPAAQSFKVAHPAPASHPLHIELQSGAFSKPMKTRIGRNAGCGFCHQGTGDSSHSPAVFLKDIGE